jgi:two-component system chemotaxis response regulator CheB
VSDILVVDDSPSVRERLRAIIEEGGRFRVRTANDPYEAVERMKEQAPDAIVLDVEMPRMDGVTFLKKLMRQHPLPVIICTDQVERGLAALDLGALEVIGKPLWSDPEELAFWSERLRESLRQAIAWGEARRKGVREAVRVEAGAGVPGSRGEVHTADVILRRADFDARGAPRERVVVVGASTGGVQAVAELLRGFPAGSPPVVVVQHMPPGFTRAFANRLEADPRIQTHVCEAASGTVLSPGWVYVVPGHAHGVVRRHGSGYRLDLANGPPVCRHRPSVDVLFRSAAQAAGPRATGILLTGMGSDGADGLLEMFQAGSFTIAQDEATSVVFGMPAQGIKRGGAGRVLALDRIAPAVASWSRGTA